MVDWVWTELSWDRTSRDQSYSTYHQDVKQTWPWPTNRDDDQCGLVLSVKQVCGCPSGWLPTESVRADSAASLSDRPAGLRSACESVATPVRCGGTGLCWAAHFLYLINTVTVTLLHSHTTIHQQYTLPPSHSTTTLLHSHNYILHILHSLRHTFNTINIHLFSIRLIHLTPLSPILHRHFITCLPPITQ